MTDLLAWLNDPADLSVHALIGQAGSGKTRLAIELCRAVDPPDGQGGWRAAFIDPRAIQTVVETLVTRVFVWDRPHFLVLDYAATAHRALGSWLDALARNEQAPKLRFLLLDREAPEGFGWWEDLTHPGGDSESARADLFLVRLKCRLEGRDQHLKLLNGQAGEIQELGGAQRMSANRRPTIGHASCLRVSVTEGGQITNRDKLNGTAVKHESHPEQRGLDPIAGDCVGENRPVRSPSPCGSRERAGQAGRLGDPHGRHRQSPGIPRLLPVSGWLGATAEANPDDV